MDNITFDEVELNELLELVQDQIYELHNRTVNEDQYLSYSKSYREIEQKILKMLEG